MLPAQPPRSLRRSPRPPRCQPRCGSTALARTGRVRRFEGVEASAKWSDTRKHRLEGAGQVGISSPIVWGDLVFVTDLRRARRCVRDRAWCRRESARRRREAAHSRRAPPDGKVVFSSAPSIAPAGARRGNSAPAEGPLPSVHEKHNLASPSPVTDGERVRLVRNRPDRRESIPAGKMV